MRRKSPFSIADWGLQTGPKCSEMLQPLAKASVLRPRACGGAVRWGCPGRREMPERGQSAAIVRRTAGASVHGHGLQGRHAVASCSWALIGGDSLDLGR